MNDQVTLTALMAAVFLALFATAELAYHRLHVKAEHTRKFVHAGTGVISMLFPLLFVSVWPVVFLCAGFALILVFSLRFGMLKSINAIGRDSYGSIAYPAAVLLSFIFFLWFECHGETGARHSSFYLPVLVLAFADPAAALTGRTWPAGRYRVAKETKTLMGSSAFFIVAALTCFLVFHFSGHCLPPRAVFPACLLIAGISALTEAVSSKGIDNLLIPLAVILTYYLFYRFAL